MDQLSNLYPPFAVTIVRLLNDAERVTGYKMRVTEGFRSFSDQAARYAQGRTAPGEVVTNAQAGLSLHQYGLAVDCCFTGVDPYLKGLSASNKARADTAWCQYGQLVEGWHLTWGGHFHLLKDMPHAENHFGLPIRDLQELHGIGGLKGVWTQIDKIRGQDSSSQWPDLIQL